MDNLRNVDHCLSSIVLMLISFLAGLTLAGHLSWAVIAALGTVGAVGVALFLPWRDKQHRIKSIGILVRNELANNEEIRNRGVVCFTPEHKVLVEGRSVRNNPGFEDWRLAAMFLKEMRFDHWNHHWAEYSLMSPERYLKERETVNRLLKLKELALKAESDIASRAMLIETLYPGEHDANINK
ncbi:hypothetical protein SAMN02745127_02059 [Oceanospirillum multiglobuliferum]|uniref:Uncharacterized protein n=1 Tax=Oceanospirillum multiglobuliferum TaxID=64969 RepID=A0A1T4QXB6_9GAMM|nr:hypothetical protein [Oceanospirillum multiglobuliferum]OPX57078.1 hypothetical protein BTE48_01215 [Oceanospirillum multiglobuliferum]SKA08354.1 hypothetical protein SAMN02745127_02059 [Oceanospirillum multiglobuliferum]